MVKHLRKISVAIAALALAGAFAILPTSFPKLGATINKANASEQRTQDFSAIISEARQKGVKTGASLVHNAGKGIEGDGWYYFNVDPQKGNAIAKDVLLMLDDSEMDGIKSETDLENYLNTYTPGRKPVIMQDDVIDGKSYIVAVWTVPDDVWNHPTEQDRVNGPFGAPQYYKEILSKYGREDELPSPQEAPLGYCRENALGCFTHKNGTQSLFKGTACYTAIWRDTIDILNYSSNNYMTAYETVGGSFSLGPYTGHWFGSGNAREFNTVIIS
jgi:hypothetical protein